LLEGHRQVVQDQVNTTLTPTDPVILHSLPGCQPQAAHCDYLPDKSLKMVSDEQMPLGALIPLMPKTYLNIWPYSTRLSLSTPEYLKKIKPIKCQKLELNPGDILIFRGDFVHAGSRYDIDNYRIHYYLDSPVVPRMPNRTWLIGSHGGDDLRRIIQPEKLPIKQNRKNDTGLASTVGLFKKSIVTQSQKRNTECLTNSQVMGTDLSDTKRKRLA
jgi:hypothetical protein